MFHLAVVFMPVLLLGLGVAIIATLLAGLGLLIAAMVGGTSVALLVKDRSLKRLMLLGCGVLAMLLGLWLKAEDRKKKYGLELPNIKK